MTTREPIRCFAPRAALLPRLDALASRFREFVESGRYIDGDWVARFEEAAARKVGMPHAAGCGSGTAALTLALAAAGVRKGDEVLTVANTYYATARAIADSGAKPVFVDIDPASAQIDPRAVEAAVSGRTAAILAVHLYGYPAPSEALRAIADKRKLVLVEDCAHAFGAGRDGAGYGRLADFACHSFYPTKTLGALGDAGMVATRDGAAAERIRGLRYFADESRTRFDAKALHARLDAIQAALLLALLDDVDRWVSARRERAAIHRERLSPNGAIDLSAPDAAPYVFPLRVPDRDAFLARMRAEDIWPGVHYSVDLHRLPEFGAMPVGSLPHTERHNKEVVSLPVHPGLAHEDARRVAECAARAALPATRA